MTPTFCKHYTGLIGPGLVQHTTCRAGVEYESLRRVRLTSPLMQYPCFDPGARPACSSADYPTPVEEHERNRQIAEWLTAWIASINAGACPECSTPMIRRQVGRSVYAHPCGHRLYQGRAAAHFEE